MEMKYFKLRSSTYHLFHDKCIANGMTWWEWDEKPSSSCQNTDKLARTIKCKKRNANDESLLWKLISIYLLLLMFYQYSRTNHNKCTASYTRMKTNQGTSFCWLFSTSLWCTNSWWINPHTAWGHCPSLVHKSYYSNRSSLKPPHIASASVFPPLYDCKLSKKLFYHFVSEYLLLILHISFSIQLFLINKISNVNFFLRGYLLK